MEKSIKTFEDTIERFLKDIYFILNYLGLLTALVKFEDARKSIEKTKIWN